MKIKPGLIEPLYRIKDEVTFRYSGSREFYGREVSIKQDDATSPRYGSVKHMRRIRVLIMDFELNVWICASEIEEF